VITLTRRTARCLRGVLRRSALGLPRTGPIAPLVLRADGRQLRAQYRYDGLAVEHVSPCPRADSGIVALPLEALADFEGRDESPVAIEPAGPRRVVARWADRGVPASRTYDTPDIATLPEMPAPPAPWHESATALLDALAEACATAGEASPRYGLDCVQLRGGRGEVAATDGRQLLVHGGFALPWAGDLLVGRRPLFARPELPRDDGVDVGLDGEHVALRAGPWTLWLQVRTGARFPDVDRALPAAGAAATRLCLHPADARFLADALDRLPGGAAEDAPATLDLDGRVAVRARAEAGPATELVLARSAYSGPPARVAMNRRYLARAARLGFVEVEVAGPDAALCARDGRRCFAWQPLGEAAAVGPSDDAVRIESTAAEAPTPARAAATIATPLAKAGTTRHPGSSPRPATPGGMESLIEEAAALHAALGDARSRSARLVSALRGERRRSRLLASTIAQLRQIRLRDVAG
jgi:hypothetical protein